MRSRVGPHKLDFAICKNCFWVVTLMNSDLYRQSLCPVCSGILDIIRFTKPSEAKIVDYISAVVNMKYIYSKTDFDESFSEESWSVFEQFVPDVF